MWKEVLQDKQETGTEEDKKEKFERLALKRMDRALNILDLIANLSTSRYHCKEEQATAITSELKKKVNYIESLFCRRIVLNDKKELKKHDR